MGSVAALKLFDILRNVERQHALVALLERAKPAHDDPSKQQKGEPQDDEYAGGSRHPRHRVAE